MSRHAGLADGNSQTSPPLRAPATRREVLAWAMYDWANSAYSTLQITVMVQYITKVLYPDNFGLLLYSWGISATMLISAILAPIIGAMADANGSKIRWLAATALPGAVTTSLMYFATEERAWLMVLLFPLANLFFELSFGFYNAFLPELADEKNMGRVSAWGYALGYLGGGLALAGAFALITFSEQLGLPSVVSALRVSLLLTGLWWGVFTLPAVLFLRDRRMFQANRLPFRAAARVAASDVAKTLRNVRMFRALTIFLVGFLLFNDGVQTMISQASIFAGRVLAMETAELLQVILMIQFVALPGSMIVGHAADRIGQKLMLILCLLVWIGLLAASFFITTKTQFWIMAAIAAVVLGGTQSVSRSIMGLMTPKSRTAEFFGFFNLSGKATSVAGPFLFSSILAVTESAHLAIVSLLVFFVAGLAFILPLNVDDGQRVAQEVDAAEVAKAT